ncbi:MAG: hypothetical protein JW725_00390 [Candidatus Babeliaceae bacterium]|nr:hypothetical protein [Candidatus Babeliaceae bacterium]
MKVLYRKVLFLTLSICMGMSLNAHNVSVLVRAQAVETAFFVGLPFIVGLLSTEFKKQGELTDKTDLENLPKGCLEQLCGYFNFSADDQTGYSFWRKTLVRWLCGYITILTTTVCHELGHALTNFVLCANLPRIFIGAPFPTFFAGRQLWRAHGAIEIAGAAFAWQGILPYTGFSQFPGTYADWKLFPSVLAGPLSGAAFGPWLGPLLFMKLYRKWHGLNADQFCPIQASRSKIATALALHDLIPRAGVQSISDGAHLCNIWNFLLRRQLPYHARCLPLPLPARAISVRPAAAS